MGVPKNYHLLIPSIMELTHFSSEHGYNGISHTTFWKSKSVSTWIQIAQYARHDILVVKYE